MMMKHAHRPHDSDRPQPGAPRRRLPMPAKLGMASFLLGILMCVPLSGLVAIMLGFWSLPRLREHVHLAGFARAARWGILLGTVNTIVQCMGVSQFQSWYASEIQTAMETRTRSAFEAIERGDTAGVQSFWVGTPDSQPTDDAIMTFRQSLSDRYGALRQLTVSHSEFLDDDSGGLFGPPRGVASLLLTFEGGEFFGEARYRMTISQSAIVPVPYLEMIRIEDPDQPPLTLGTATAPPNSVSGAGTSSGESSGDAAANGDESS